MNADTGANVSRQNNVVERLRRDLKLHRTRNGRLEVDYMSRRLEPKLKMVRVGGVAYDRKSLARWLLERGAYEPATRRPFSRGQVEDIANTNPYRIFGKAPVYDTDRVSVS